MKSCHLITQVMNVYCLVADVLIKHRTNSETKVGNNNYWHMWIKTPNKINKFYFILLAMYLFNFLLVPVFLGNNNSVLRPVSIYWNKIIFIESILPPGKDWYWKKFALAKWYIAWKWWKHEVFYRWLFWICGSWDCK